MRVKLLVFSVSLVLMLTAPLSYAYDYFDVTNSRDCYSTNNFQQCNIGAYPPDQSTYSTAYYDAECYPYRRDDNCPFDLRNHAMPDATITRNQDLSTGDDNPYQYPELNIDR